MSIYKIVLIFFSLLLLTGTAVRAQELQATVDKDNVSVGEAVTLTVTYGKSTANKPVLPDLEEHFTLLGEYFSSNTVIENFSMKQTVSWNYKLLPLKEGSMVIGQVSLDDNGKTVVSKPIFIKVTKAKTPVPEKSGLAQLFPFLPGALTAQPFVKGRLEKKNFYLGEQIPLNVDIYLPSSYSPFRNPQRLNLRFLAPSMAGFLVQRIEPSHMFTERLNGLEFHVERITLALYPIQSGTLTVLPVSVIQDGRELKTEATEISVQELPEKPAGFSNGVGDFEVSAKRPQTPASKGKPVTFEFTVSGKGNASQIRMDFPELKNAGIFNISDKTDKQVANEDFSVLETKTFTVSVIPETEGKLEIPPVEFCFFNPVSETYYTKSTIPMTVSVMAAGAEETSVETAVLSPGENIKDYMTIKPEKPFYRNPLYLIPNGALLLGLLLKAGTDTARRRRNRHMEKHKKSYAAKILKQELTQAANAETEDFCGSLRQSLYRYLCLKTDFTQHSASSSALYSHMREKGIPEEEIDLTRDLFRQCDEIRFLGRKADETEKKAFIEKSLALAKKLEKTGKKTSVIPLLTAFLLFGAAGCIPDMADLTQTFSQANREYGEGNYEEAQRLYSRLESRVLSPELYFNMGRTLDGRQEPAQAFYYYEKAGKLAPRDPEIAEAIKTSETNLFSAGALIHERGRRILTKYVTPNELSLLWTLSLLCTAGALYGGEAGKRLLKTALVFFALSTLLFSAGIAEDSRKYVIVTAPSAELRNMPLPVSETTVTLMEGSLLRKISRQGGFTFVSLSSSGKQYKGWLAEKDIKEL